MIHGTGPYADLIQTTFPNFPGCWLTHEVPTHAGRPDYYGLQTAVAHILDALPAHTLVINSIPMPVGTCRAWETTYPQLVFAVQPENIRPASGQITLHHPRIVIGSRHDYLYEYFEALFNPYGRVLWMTPESAELAKHALNTFLALNIQFGNEIGELCATTGADPISVVAALRTEPRISDHAPLEPGPPPSSHLLREVHNWLNIHPDSIVEGLL